MNCQLSLVSLEPDPLFYFSCPLSQVPSLSYDQRQKERLYSKESGCTKLAIYCLFSFSILIISSGKKMRNFTKTSFYAFVLSLLVVIKVTGRSLRYSSSESISDGIDHVEGDESSFLLLKGLDSSEECEQMYGFLPCSYSPLGHLFLILIYEYLLFHGECYVAAGGERIFKILGPGIFGASAFHVLGSLPEALILLASGLLDDKETAQEYVYTGVGLLAGSTILLLTILWGTCVIVGNRNISKNSESNPPTGSNPAQNPFWRFLSFSTGCGITTDVETSHTARIMVLSVIPFLIIQIPKVCNLSSSAERIVIIITLIISIVFLFLYFFYQIFEPWIQKRRLEYVKHEHLVVDILRHVQKHALGRLLSEDGTPNVPAIKRLFKEVDQDGDNLVSFGELRKFLHEIKYKRWNVDKDIVVSEVLKEFDLNGDKKITVDEFVNGFTKWLDEAKRSMGGKKYHSVKSLKDLYQILQPWIQKKREEQEMQNHLILEILGQIQSSAIGSLLAEDGTPDTATIKRLFENIDLDKDNCISQSELKQLVADIKFRNIPLDADEAVEKIMEELDINGDKVLNEEEFVTGFSKWLNTSNDQTPNSIIENQDEIYQKKWEETDMLVEDRNVDTSPWAWVKAIMLLVVGIAILGVLAEPLIHSVQHFSKSASIPSFFIAFILVPLATNARGAISAITAASWKNPRTTSLTFSEIYGSVFMNNILGLSVLLSLVYFRGLSWDFSAEVLIVLIVSAIMGITASFSSTFPIWTSSVAYLLYPLSLILVYVLDDFFR